MPLTPLQPSLSPGGLIAFCMLFSSDAKQRIMDKQTCFLPLDRTNHALGSHGRIEENTSLMRATSVFRLFTMVSPLSQSKIINNQSKMSVCFLFVFFLQRRMGWAPGGFLFGSSFSPLISNVSLQFFTERLQPRKLQD